MYILTSVYVFNDKFTETLHIVLSWDTVCIYWDTLYVYLLRLYVYVLTSVYVFNDTFTETLCMCIYGDNPYSSFLRHCMFIYWDILYIYVLPYVYVFSDTLCIYWDTVCVFTETLCIVLSWAARVCGPYSLKLLWVPRMYLSSFYSFIMYFFKCLLDFYHMNV